MKRISVTDLQLRTLLDLAYREYKNTGDNFYKELVKAIQVKK